MIPVTADHPTLEYEFYLKPTLIKKGRILKICEHCKDEILIGTSHNVHMFHGYESYPTHLECSLLFTASLK